MDKAIIKRQLAGIIKGALSRLKSLWQELSSLRLGSQLGLIISDNSLRLCLVRRRLHRSRIMETATFPLDPGNAGNWTAQVEASANIITSYLAARRLKRIPINIGLLGEDISFRRMNLPPMPRRELEAAIKWEGEKLFPYEISQCVIDYQIAGGRHGADGGNLSFNIIAAESKFTEIIYDRFRAAGLKIGQIGFLPSFMTSLLDQSRLQNDRQELILHLDKELSMAIFVRSGVLEFYQQFVTRPQVLAEGDFTPANLDSIAAELNSFIDLYNGQSFGNTVHTIFLTGKFADDERTLTFIREIIGLPCQSITEFTGLPDIIGRLAPARIANYLDVIVTGLAHPGDHRLAPAAVRRFEEKMQMMVRAGAVAILALLTAGALQVQLHYLESQKKNDLDMKMAVATAFEHSPGYQGYVNLIGKLNRNEAIINRNRNHRESHFHLVLKELTLLLPDHVSLTAIDLDQKEGRYILRLDGNVRLDGFSPEIILAGYVESLGNSPFFDNVSVFNHNKKREHNRFDLTFQLKMDARV